MCSVFVRIRGSLWCSFLLQENKIVKVSELSFILCPLIIILDWGRIVNISSIYGELTYRLNKKKTKKKNKKKQKQKQKQNKRKKQKTKTKTILSMLRYHSISIHCCLLVCQ